jgi:hypothetical protein
LLQAEDGLLGDGELFVAAVTQTQTIENVHAPKV